MTHEVRPMTAVTGFLVLVVLVVAVQTGWFIFIMARSPELENADLISVFAGDEARVAMGIDVARAGKAKHFAISSFPQGSDWKKRIDRLSQESVCVHRTGARTTWLDALATARLMRQHRWHSVILVTSYHHMPRSYFLMRLATLFSDHRIVPYPVAYQGINGYNWYHSSEGRRLFLSEMGQFWGSLLESTGLDVKRWIGHGRK